MPWPQGRKTWRFSAVGRGISTRLENMTNQEVLGLKVPHGAPEEMQAAGFSHICLLKSF